MKDRPVDGDVVVTTGDGAIEVTIHAVHQQPLPEQARHQDGYHEVDAVCLIHLDLDPKWVGLGLMRKPGQRQEV